MRQILFFSNNKNKVIEIKKIFDELHRSGNTIILVNHEDDIAKYSNRIVRLLDGKVVSDESVKK